MNHLILLATTNGLVVARPSDAGGWRLDRRVLAGQHLTSVIAREGVILVGARDGVRRSDDLGETWRAMNTGLTEPYIRWLAYHPQVSDFEVAGTEPAGLYVSRDGGETWRGAPEVPSLRDQHGWFLPYSPEAGCVRDFAFNGQRIYAAVEVGGLLRSDDGAQTWRLVAGSDGNPDLNGPPEPLLYPDVHSIHVHPSSPDRLYAPTGGGFYVSSDGGATWELCYECYVRAGWVDPADPDHILLGPADGVGSRGRIEVSRDGGRTWMPASGGLQVPWPRNMVERFAPAGDSMLAILAGGALLASPIGQWQWSSILSEAGHVHAAAFMETE
jgi:photosystem II stability/assembly factor-like uncharacterized protein